jgi:hypothetical protein
VTFNDLLYHCESRPSAFRFTSHKRRGPRTLLDYKNAHLYCAHFPIDRTRNISGALFWAFFSKRRISHYDEAGFKIHKRTEETAKKENG